MIPKTPTNVPPKTAEQVLSPEDEDVFQDTREEANAGPQVGQAAASGTDKRRSDRKRSQVNYADTGRVAKKQRESVSSARNLKNLDDEPATATQEPEDQFTKLMNMIKALDGSINKKLDRQGREISRKLSESATNIEEALIGIDTRIHKVTEDVEKLGERVKKQEVELPALVDKTVKDQLSGVEERLRKLENGTTTNPREIRKMEDYWQARRSLRMSPIRGDLKEEIKKFIVDRLRLDGGLLDSLERDAIRTLPARPNDRIKDEVVIKFASVKDRDLVKAAGFKLAGTEGSMRLELPSHLLGQHRTLNRAAADLRKAKPGTKTYVKFEDESQSLVMDYRLEGGGWHRLRPEQAREALPTAAPQQIAEVSAQDFEALLGPATGANATPIA